MRRAAAKALGRLGGAKARKSLKASLGVEKDKDVKAMIKSALKNVRIIEQQQIFR